MCAKVTGPLMSLDASGTVGNTTVFSKWKGRNYVRLRVIPKNVNSIAQQAVRSILGTLAKAVRAVTTSFDDLVNFLGSQFFIDAVAVAPTGQSWVSYLQKIMNSIFDATVTAYAALDSTHKGYWQTAALGIGLSSYTDKSGDAHTAGEQLFMLGTYAVNVLSYSGFASGIAAADGTETGDFADYVNVAVTP